METVIISLVIIMLLGALFTVWKRNGALHKTNTSLKNELEKSKKIIQFFREDSEEAIKPEFLSSLELSFLKESYNKIKEFYQENFYANLLEHLSMADELGAYVAELNQINDEDEKDYLLKTLSSALFDTRYQGVAHLIYNAAQIQDEYENDNGQMVINLVLNNANLIYPEKRDNIVKHLESLIKKGDVSPEPRFKLRQFINDFQKQKKS